MQVTVEVAKGLTLTVEGDTHKQVFEKLGQPGWVEVFTPESCGYCKNPNTQFVVRKSKSTDPKKKKGEFTYYERVCTKCWAKLSYGQHQEGGSLYPKRKLENGEYDKEHRGWKKYEKKEEGADA